MGRVLVPHGVHGWLKVRPYGADLDALLGFSNWWIASAEGWREIRAVECRPHGAGLMAKFPDVDDRDAAGAFSGRDVAVPRSALPETQDGEFYWQDLVGLDVQNAEGVPLGRVDRLIETGGNDVLVVEGERQRLIPFAGAVVLDVNLAARRIRVDWGEDW